MAGLWSRTMTIIKSKWSAMLNRAENPSQTLDYSYEKQLESLQNVKRGIADVVTAKKRLQLQTQQLEQNVVKLETQARQALAANREDLARAALERKSGMQQQLQQLDGQVQQLDDQQQKLVANEQALSAKIEQFRSQKEVIKAQYSAAEAQVRGSAVRWKTRGWRSSARRTRRSRCRRALLPSMSSSPPGSSRISPPIRRSSTASWRSSRPRLRWIRTWQS